MTTKQDCLFSLTVDGKEFQIKEFSNRRLNSRTSIPDMVTPEGNTIKKRTPCYYICTRENGETLYLLRNNELSGSLKDSNERYHYFLTLQEAKNWLNGKNMSILNVENYVFHTNAGRLRVERQKPEQFRIYNVDSGKQIGVCNQVDLDEEEAFEWIWIANIEQFGVEVYAAAIIDKEVFTWKELAPVDKIAAINKLRNISNLTIADAKIVVEEFLAQ